MNDVPRILIVDDTPANIKVLHNLLREDYVLSVATSGAAALEIAFSDDRPDLVLLDVMMPEMDGHEVCRRFKADPRTRDVPVIFVTSMSEVEDEAKGFALGAVDYISKPIRPPIVEARVATHLELARTRKRWLSRTPPCAGTSPWRPGCRRACCPRSCRPSPESNWRAGCVHRTP